MAGSSDVGNSKVGWKKAATFFDMHIIHSPKQFLVIMSIWHLGNISSDSVLSLEFRPCFSCRYFLRYTSGKLYIWENITLLRPLYFLRCSLCGNNFSVLHVAEGWVKMYARLIEKSNRCVCFSSECKNNIYEPLAEASVNRKARMKFK